MDFDFILKDNNREAALKRLAMDGRPVKIYGTGRFAMFAAQLLIKRDIKILGFIDEEKYYKPDRKIHLEGDYYACECLKNMMTADIDCNIVIGIQDYRKKRYIQELVPDSVLVEWIDNVDYHYMDNLFLEKYKKEIDEIYNVLNDKKSKLCLYEFLNARYSGNPANLCELVDNSDGYTYDWRLLQINQSDVIVDGGAYNGDTLSELRRYIGMDPKRIFAFEPDNKNYEALKIYVEENDYNSTVVICAGLYSEDGKMNFSSSGTMGASIKQEGESSIDVISIDNHDEYRNVTVIKMDIEGSEIAALNGAREIIKRNRPRLAICIYHNNEDIIHAFNLLKPYGYKFYLRQHAYCAEETVLYAV